MADKQPRCSECAALIKSDFLYCPMCKTNLKDAKVEKNMNGVEAIISDPEPITSAQLTIIYNIFQENDRAKNNPSLAHLLEEKICHKFIRSIGESEYTVKDMIVIAKKIGIISRLEYSREY